MHYCTRSMLCITLYAKIIRMLNSHKPTDFLLTLLGLKNPALNFLSMLSSQLMFLISNFLLKEMFMLITTSLNSTF